MGIESIGGISEQSQGNKGDVSSKNQNKGSSNFHTLVGLMLSSQTNDKVTSATVKELIEDNGLTPSSILCLSDQRLKQLIGKVGFYNRKAEYLKKVAQILLDTYDGKPPTTYEELVALPGVGPKMAHLFCHVALGVVRGISIDTHLHRILQRWKWVDSTCSTPAKTAKALEVWLPKPHWKEINPLVVGFGQVLCTARAPKCNICPLSDLCPSSKLVTKRTVPTSEKSPRNKRRVDK
mmetsp:Transcript_18921/g.29677  ORF Transcript_18921/g.29677 Transcript_18921/m.29677 type:complete len:236 (-) Transcript_18921:27-734(-)